jgi:TPR repeat protein/DNA-directed RNA polymerase subunit RPC12/RpoP
MKIKCQNCGFTEKTNKELIVKVLGAAMPTFGFFAWTSFLFAGTGFAMAICVAIIAGGPALLMYKDEIVKWLASKGYKCSQCGHEDWVGISDNHTEDQVVKDTELKVSESINSISSHKIEKPRIKLIDKKKPFNLCEVKVLNAKDLKRLEVLAQVNNGGAENKMAQMYYKGIHVEQNYSQAFYWANIAAQKGNRNSQILLSVLYKNGLGVSCDQTCANFWLEQSKAGSVEVFESGLKLDEELITDFEKIKEIKQLAKFDNGDAENKLGQIYYAGIKTNTNYVKAFYYSNIAAEKGNKDAQFRLFSLYKHGWGTVRDEELAQFWLNKSRNLDVSVPQKSVQLNWSDISDLEQFNEIRDLAKIDNGDAENRLGQIYYAGIKTKTNYVKAFYYSKIAAEKGNKDAQFRLFSLYNQGWGTVRNEELAQFWLNKSREK